MAIWRKMAFYFTSFLEQISAAVHRSHLPLTVSIPFWHPLCLFSGIFWFCLNLSENLPFKSTSKAPLERERRVRNNYVFSNILPRTDISDYLCYSWYITTWCLYHTLQFSTYFSLIWFALQPWEVSENRYYFSCFTNENSQNVVGGHKTGQGTGSIWVSWVLIECFSLSARLTRIHIQSLNDC